ncbi:MAG TPA: peptidylprolyl isomerase [Caulobacteraceae bacterium]|nr:peptidylprolyl isomerase [Caulobacteraceae bacterium]
MSAFSKNARRLAGAAFGGVLALLVGLPATAQDAAPSAEDAQTLAPPAPQALTEEVIASVNDDVITNYDLGQRVRLIAVTAGIQPTRDDLAELQRYALNQLIEERLEIQELHREEAEQSKDGKTITIVASDSDVDDEIADMAKDNHMNADQLMATFARQGIAPETLRSQIRAQVSWRRWIQGFYGSRLRIGEDQIKAYQAQAAAEADKPKYLVNEVYIDAQRVGGMQQAMDEANQLVTQLHQGAQFGAVARQFSAADTAANGGNAGWVTGVDYPEEVRDALTDMRPGSLSAPIQTRDGVYIIYLQEKQAGGSSLLVSLKQAAIALPADAPQDQVDAARAKLEALRAQLHGCDGFEATASKVDGVLAGDLGEAEVKDLAPAFRDAATSLPVGQISEPIRSDQGLHLLAVCNKRRNSAQGLNHDQIENMLFGQALTMISKRQVRDLRNAASIEFHGSSGS